jgi:hypothetical protein
MRSEATTVGTVANTRRVADVALRAARERRVQAVRQATDRLEASRTKVAARLHPRIAGVHRPLLHSSIRSEVPTA